MPGGWWCGEAYKTVKWAFSLQVWIVYVDLERLKRNNFVAFNLKYSSTEVYPEIFFRGPNFFFLMIMVSY